MGPLRGTASRRVPRPQSPPRARGVSVPAALRVGLLPARRTRPAQTRPAAGPGTPHSAPAQGRPRRPSPSRHPRSRGLPLPPDRARCGRGARQENPRRQERGRAQGRSPLRRLPGPPPHSHRGSQRQHCCQARGPQGPPLQDQTPCRRGRAPAGVRRGLLLRRGPWGGTLRSHRTREPCRRSMGSEHPQAPSQQGLGKRGRDLQLSARCRGPWLQVRSTESRLQKPCRRCPFQL
mmetsp:Transcript_20170/g.48031  ORF Transcript_20170/g.48031 Transcript_20170/m.48031 type:complete len:234 (-) Transcript_20170:668-1369(-)